MPLPQLADRYLAGVAGEPAVDLRVAKSTLERVLDDLAAAARREGFAQEAAALRRQAGRIRAPAATVPTLEQFAASLAADFYSEAQLLELYREAYGAAEAGSASAARAAQRRARLIERQLALLTQLEARAGGDIRLDSPIADWFEPRLAARLNGAGMLLVGQLVDRIRGIERRWWTGVPAVGEQKAARIRRFLEAHLGPIPSGRALAAVAAGAVVPAAFGVVPLERLYIPAALSGAHGRFRAPPERCTIAAVDDAQAVQTFLASKVSTHTKTAYRRELERLLLWAVVQHGCALSSLAVEDCLRYRAFLADPQPASQWCAPRSRKRFGPLWRPFEGPLSPASQKHALGIVSSFFEWCIRAGYLTANPMASVPTRAQAVATEAERSALAEHEDSLEDAARSGAKSVLERTLTRAQLDDVLAALATLPPTGRTRRARFALVLAFGTGLRLSELVRARRGHLVYLPGDGKTAGGWLLRVLGKRHKRRDVPVPAHVIAQLQDYLEARGLPRELSQVKRGTYLLGAADDLGKRFGPARHDLASDTLALPGQRQVAAADGIKAITLHRDIKRALGRAAEQLAAHDPDAAARLRAASTHWLRHTHASQAVEAGVPLDVVRDALGHASLATTSIYVRSEERRRIAEMQRMWGPPSA